MPRTPNHGYNVPNEGAKDWHLPLNDNFEQFDADVEVRDIDANKSDYVPKSGAKFFAVGTGKTYVGDGSKWAHVPTTGVKPEFSEVTVKGPLSAQSLLAFESVIPTINPDGENDLGVGTDSPATQLHVADDPAKTGALDLSRMTAVVENTSGESNGDVLGLKTGVDDPGENADFLSFLGGSAQLGQIHGDGDGGLRFGAAKDLTLAAGGSDVLAVDGGDGTVEVGDLTTNDPTPKLYLKHKKSVDNYKTPTLKLEGETYPPGVDFWVQGKRRARIRPNLNASQLDIGTSLGAVWVDTDLFVDGTLTAYGTKNFVQSVDTDDGEKEVVYTATEAPTPRTEASGVAELEDGRAEIELPDHFGWVTDGDEPIHVQTTPYSADTGGLAVVERSTDYIVVEDVGGEGDYEFSYTVRGTRDGYADEEVVREPTPDAADRTPPAPADD